MIQIKTERLIIEPMTLEELQNLIDLYINESPDLSQAYREMLENCLSHPNQYLWYTSWKICSKRDNTIVGYAGFKGLSDSGCVEIGYGIDNEYEGNGFATEAVKGICEWAFSTDLVTCIEAETESDNIVSQKVLQKNGFISTGSIGEEGPKFILVKH